MATQGRDQFPTQTDWSAVRRCHTHDPGRRRQAMCVVVEQYWKPVYCYLLRQSGDTHKAADLTQGFFEEVILGRDLIQRADAAKGRFRTFLLAALDNFVKGERRRQKARMRAPAGRTVSLAGLDGWSVPEPAAEATPEQAFMFTWASSLLNTVLAEVQARCVRDDLGTHWAMFQGRILQPILANTYPASLAELRVQHGVADEATASAMIVTVKRRFRKALRAAIRAQVGSEAEVEEEIREIMQICSGSRARS